MDTANCPCALFLVTRTRLAKVRSKYKVTGKFDIPYLILCFEPSSRCIIQLGHPQAKRWLLYKNLSWGKKKKNSLGVVLTCKTQQACASLEFLQELSKARREHVYRKATENWGIFQVSVILIHFLMKSTVVTSFQWKGSYVIPHNIQWDLVFP